MGLQEVHLFLPNDHNVCSGHIHRTVDQHLATPGSEVHLICKSLTGDTANSRASASKHLQGFAGEPHLHQFQGPGVCYSYTSNATA
jgi:hypothetical protein